MGISTVLPPLTLQEEIEMTKLHNSLKIDAQAIGPSGNFYLQQLPTLMAF
jgi:hypothetical protein